MGNWLNLTTPYTFSASTTKSNTTDSPASTPAPELLPPPQVEPSGKKYISPKPDWSLPETFTGPRPLRFEMTVPQYYYYYYKGSGDLPNTSELPKTTPVNPESKIINPTKSGPYVLPDAELKEKNPFLK